MPKLTWVGKEKVVNHHQEVPFRVLEHQYNFTASDSNSQGNKIIHGDNLEALKSLLPEYEGKIKCIYIDPPYNTGNEGWIYNDNVNDEKIKKWLGQVVGKEGEDLSRHDKWLCMMYPRLKLLHKLLADDGVIFISIDDNEQANVKLIMDEIFGFGNFVANVIWQKKQSPQNDARFFSDMHDFLICFAKNKANSDNKGWSRNLLPRTESQNQRYKNPDNDERGIWTSGDVSVKTYNASTDYPITTPSGRIVNPPAGYCWRFSKEKFEELIADNRIWFGSNGDNVPRLKRFLFDVQDGIVPVTIWFRSEVGDNQEGKQEVKQIFSESSFPFETPKPSRLIERVLQIATDKDSIILDSFAGSGTTAHSVLKLNKEDGGNRKFILIETMDYAETITAERVRRVMQGYGEGSKAVEGLGGAFDYYEIGDRIFLEDDNLNESIGVEEIRRYVAFSENIPAEHQVSQDNEHSPYLLGLAGDTAYFFMYEKEETTTLDLEFLATLKFKPKSSIIYADNCLLTREFLQKHNIIFKKIPREITRF